MGTNALKLQELRSAREGALVLHDVRNARVSDDYYTDWSTRTQRFDDLYAGRWQVVWPDEFSEQVEPQVANIVKTGADDIVSLVCETTPQVRVEPRGTSEAAVKAAYRLEAIVRSHWAACDGDELIVPQLAYDLVGPGAAFLVIVPGDEYPTFHRVDPRGCYPLWDGTRLVDLLVVTRASAAQIKTHYGIDPIGLFGTISAREQQEYEILDYYTAEAAYTAIAPRGTGGELTTSHMVKTWRHELGRPPVAGIAWWGGDGKIRGLFDAISPMLHTAHRLMTMLLDQADQEIYAPWYTYDVENDTERPGPNTIYRGRSPEARMLRLPPAGSNPQLFTVLEYLERQARAAAGYPVQRHGEVSQSIASAAFVDRALGQLASTVRRIQRRIAVIRRDAAEIALGIQRLHLAGRHDLLIPADRDYFTDADIPERPRVRILYGAGAGLDSLNRRAALLGDLQAGIISLETAREQTDYLLRPAEEAQKRAKELVADALLQRLVTDPSIGADALMRLATRLRAGDDLLEAVEKIVDLEERARAEAQAAQARGGIIQQAPAPVGPEEIAAGARQPAASRLRPPPKPEDLMVVR